MASRQGVHDDAGQGPRRARRVRQAAAGDDSCRRRRRRPACRGQPRAAFCARWPSSAMSRRTAGILAVAAHSRARLCLSLDAELDRPGDAADAGAQRAVRRILLGGDPAGQRDRLCRARAGAAHHVDGACGWQPAAGVSHLAGPRPARLSRRRRNLAPAEVAAHRSLYAVRPSPTCRRCSIASAPTARRDFPSSTKSSNADCARSPCRCSTAAARRSAPSIFRHAFDAHDAQRNARAVSSELNAHRRSRFRRRVSERRGAQCAHLARLSADSIVSRFDYRTMVR